MQKMKRLLKNRRGISPVIATVILVAVTIVVAISVAYWMGSLTSSYTAQEQIEMPSSYPEYVSSDFLSIISPTVTSAPPGTTLTVSDTAGLFVGQSITISEGSLSEVHTIASVDSATVLTLEDPIVETFTTPTFVARDSGWKIHIELKNTGSADSAINNVFLNAIPLKNYPTGSIRMYHTDDTDPANRITDLSTIAVQVEKGTTRDIIIWIHTDVKGCDHGVTINLQLHSAGGFTYPASVNLP